MSEFRDHFSGHAAAYSRHRPTYPDALFDWVATIAPSTDLAWDCGTGNGQAAVALSRRFRRVIGSDASAQQIDNASRAPRVEYRVAPAEDFEIENNTLDAVVVAQALHWFDHEQFFAEVGRVLRPGGIFVAWCYELLTVSTDVDTVIGDFYRNVIGDYWLKERRHIEAGYRTIDIPFDELTSPAFEIDVDWSAEELVGYLATWSAVQRYREATGSDPIPELTTRIRDAWKPGHRGAKFPLSIRASRKPA